MLTSLDDPLIRWNEDGSPFSQAFGDIYFSSGDGEAESRHVFLEGCALPSAWSGRGRYTVAETGFGTGLNFLLVWQEWCCDPQRCDVLDYISIEASPLSRGDLEKVLSFFPHLSEYVRTLLKAWPPASPGVHVLTFEEGRVRLHLWFDDVGAALSQMSATVDAWFLDGFAPSKNPSMWRNDVLKSVAALSSAGARLATFTAAGHVRRALESFGFSVSRRSGYGRKRHCIAACFQNSPVQKPSCSSWVARPRAMGRGARIAVIGAGIAGCCVASSLQRAGFEPIVIDRTGCCGSEASGNPCALVKPRLSLDSTYRGRFYTQAFLYAIRCLEQLHVHMDDVILDRGSLLIARNNDECTHMKGRVDASPLEGVEYVSAERAASLARVEAPLGGIWCPQALTINPRRACHSLLGGLSVIQGDVLSLERQGARWVVHMGHPLHVDAVVLTAGPESARLWPGVELPLNANRGSIMWIADHGGLPSRSVSFGGDLSSAITHEGQLCRILGATYDRWACLNDARWREEGPNDRQRLFGAVSENVPSLSGVMDENTCLGGRRALRATVPDRFPLVGPLFQAPMWKEYDRNSHDKQPCKPSNEFVLEDGLFLLSGLGSHGFQTAFLAADILASLCTGGALPIERKGWEALHPARFLMREARRRGYRV